MSGGLTANLQPHAAAGLFFIGLINRLQSTVKGSVRRIIFSVARKSSIKLPLFFLMTGLWCVQLHGVTNGFETPPPPVGSIQWQNLQRITKERQELYRKRVSVPGAMAEDVPRANGAFSTYPQRAITSPSPAPAASGIFRILCYVALFALIGVLIVRRFAPQILIAFNREFSPWALEPATAGELPAKVRAEEEAFAEFLATFRIGPAAPSRLDVLEKADPIKEFYAQAAKILRTQRTLLHDIGRASGGPDRQKLLANLRSGIISLKSAADIPETFPVWQMASALEGLVKQLMEKTGNVTPSTLRSLAGGVDLLDNLCVPGLKPDLLKDRSPKFLVVDDDLISRQAMSLALKKTFGQPDLAMDGETALAQAAQQAYDVIFLDVQLPGMDGFELCTIIHDTAINRNTPVVFVTGQSDFDARAKSALSGGNDLMGKPFLTFEITVKALTLALQGRLVQKPRQRSEQGKVNVDSLARVTGSSPPVSSSAITALSMLATETDDFIAAFLARASTHIGPLRNLCQKILQTPDEETRQNMLADAFLRINSLISRDGPEVMHPAYQTCAALEGLFKKMLQDLKHSTPSALATMTTAVDLLADLCVPGLKTDLATNPPFQILVVDDDLVARRVIVGTLQTVFSRPENVENGEMALALAREKPFDVIFLDVQMPGMDGFEVCSKIRDTIPNRTTPVVFVTGHGDVQTRARMSGIGGNDLMGKPFLTAEIIVKALTFALRGRLDQLKMQPTL